MQSTDILRHSLSYSYIITDTITTSYHNQQGNILTIDITNSNGLTVKQIN